jgi:imidazole glycerol-phosphate synthase subunit HisH
VIAIVDYRAGNLASVKKAVEALGADAVITADPAIIGSADRIILPGVGHFSATAALAPMRQAIAEALTRGVPFLGICVGMQWMFTGSDESPEAPGLDLLPGMCARFGSQVKSTHVGWNTVRAVRSSRLLEGLQRESFVYYSHSYRGPAGPDCVAVTEYGGEFAAVVEKGNAYGVQFHPEKSGTAGLHILRNFLHVD